MCIPDAGAAIADNCPDNCAADEGSSDKPSADGGADGDIAPSDRNGHTGDSSGGRRKDDQR